ncbi:hypothetical protein DBR17_17105 [Sphingomonas sp. HMWF008]|nr:hypothetical protein DBR17_17105 [Sphingomonas sp. HMWF008]
MNEITATTSRQSTLWHRKAAYPIIIVAAIAGLAMIAAAALSPARYVYDEHFHMAGARLIVDGMSLLAFLRTPLESAAGPLYPVLHFLLAGLTGLSAPAIRWVNIGLLGLSIWALSYVVRVWRWDSAWQRVAMILSIPTVWVTTGMALTEIPAMAMITFSVSAASWALTADPVARGRIWLGFALAGLCFGLGVLGRQPYLPAVIGFVLISAFVPRFRWPALAAVGMAVAVVAPVFIVWRGLLPPGQPSVGGHIVFEYGALGFAYAAIFVLLLAPRFFFTRWRWTLPASLVAALVIIPLGGVSFQVAGGIARRLPEWLAHLFQMAISSVLVGSGVALVLASAFNAWDRREDKVFVLLITLAIGLAATPAFVSHQFSSRYLMTTFPFLLLAVQPYFRPSYAAAARLAVGASLGFLSLQAYFAN